MGGGLHSPAPFPQLPLPVLLQPHPRQAGAEVGAAPEWVVMSASSKSVTPLLLPPQPWHLASSDSCDSVGPTQSSWGPCCRNEVDSDPDPTCPGAFLHPPPTHTYAKPFPSLRPRGLTGAAFSKEAASATPT